MKTTIRSSVLAGIAIGIAGFGYLASGKDIAGAILRRVNWARSSSFSCSTLWDVRLWD